MKSNPLIVVLLLLTVRCSSAPSPERKEEHPKKTATTVMEESNESSADEFIKAAEGFLNSDTFQVVVSALEGNADVAQDLARKRAINLLIAEKGDKFRSADKALIKELVESKGKVVKSSGSIQGKFYFLFQVSSPDLKTHLKR
ncbi:lipoprotein [Leptospira alstonii]|uniref:Lipoprotein n=2 Tax=Leptospira alstonii TaxID=28452 RepID=M6D4S1_9LEPT|nr:lipoprotein [Leptospira alstonii]EMJ93530.1 hypothetical protein LEP1GSC194_1194 [Leptospira alstonii serovar Sichuan str. 79601]EQA81675.1 hypothetical protein LEP1GSC193_3004 [Leptospira alstonii serovar Pingchang str. 80-412]